MTLEAPVAAAAEKLDQTYPGWESHIDLGSLNLVSCTQCILGQIGAVIGQSMGCYVHDDGVLSLGPDSNILATGFGVLVDDMLGTGMTGAFSSPKAEPLWIALIKERFNSGCLSG